jgi:hypothetical protein
VETHAVRVVNQRFATKAELVAGPLRDVLNRLLGILERARTGLDELPEVSRRHRGCELIWQRLILCLPDKLRVGAVEIDDLTAVDGADAAVRPENYDLHGHPRFLL